jgi:L-aspartate oxidase
MLQNKENSFMNNDLNFSRQSNRYITDFDLSSISIIETDFLIIGGGAAGFRSAIEAGKHGKTILITKDKLGESNTLYAQGGIAVAMNVGDQIIFHVDDTLKAGDGLCDEIAVKVMIEEGIDRVDELISWGANFDKLNNKLAFTREAAHSQRRIIHAKGDATGAETEKVLIKKASESDNVSFLDRKFVVDLITLDDRCYGVILWDEANASFSAIIAKATILAAGGLCQIYLHTSNPEVATGDGYAVAYRAGCEMTDMEFVQFHPTTLYVQGAPRFLISEAVRGEGAILINESGERFMPAYHELAELAPRDIVSRAIVAETTKTNTECVYLDLRSLDANFVKSRFPTISEKCSNYGIDISKDLIPVQVSAHFMMGGVKTNLDAETNIKGLYACGEVACTGVHGANRLASNSLLESLVFGVRSAKSAVKDIISEVPKSVFKINHQRKEIISANIDYQAFKESIKDNMWEKVGIIRDAEQLKEAIAFFDQYIDLNPKTRISFEVQNMLDISKLIAESALIRQESRGAHYRSDYPLLDDENWNCHVIFTREDT